MSCPSTPKKHAHRKEQPSRSKQRQPFTSEQRQPYESRNTTVDLYEDDAQKRTNNKYKFSATSNQKPNPVFQVDQAFIEYIQSNKQNSGFDPENARKCFFVESITRSQ